MSNPKFYTGKRCFQIKFCAFILILYLKLNYLNALDLINPNKDDDNVNIVLKPPDDILVDDSLVNNGDKNYSIEKITSVKVESEVPAKNQAYNYYSYSVSDNEITDSDNVNVQTTESSENMDLVHAYLLQVPRTGNNACMLDGLKEYTMTWAYANGSLSSPKPAKSKIRNYLFGSKPLDKILQIDPEVLLDKSYRFDVTDDELASELSFNGRSKGVTAFSAAFNGLTYVPYKTLSKMANTLEYLMLKGNNFSSFLSDGDNMRNELGIAWATFPELPMLIELDISNCMIEHIATYAFMNLTNLKTLYLSHNKILKIGSEAFASVPNLRYLDLSHLNALDVELPISPAMEQIVNLLVGVKIEQYAFKDLSQLEYLDLSYTKVTSNSAVAFSFLGEKLKYLSLCYSALPMLANSMFKNTALQGLDLSGNTYAAYSILEDTFSSVAPTLKFLFFEQSNIKELYWLKILQNLMILNLSSNNINHLTLKTFATLKQLHLLDLSSNHIGNWYNRVFTYNPKLKILNLRDNNINILTSEMLLDFQELEYLGIGDNNFVCDCVLRDLVDIATANNKKADCVNNVFANTQSLIQDNIKELNYPTNIRDNDLDIAYSGYIAAMNRYIPMLKKSYQNIKNQMNRFHMYNVLITNYYKVRNPETCPNTNQIIIYDKINGSTLKFQLLDYEDEHYWCFNETEKLNFFELNCESRHFNDMITAEIRHITRSVVIICSVILFVSTTAFVIYLKRWHIHYYYSSLKSAALLAVATQENNEIFKDISESDSNLVYDMFISYCQSDREWVLEELIPNIEVAGDMSICMHERDFQVGLTILDNIISCMDRSRCLMLLISSNFLLSHWCQFEMRLAQHRMFEATKEHLILVFLEDIPKRKRPKTLQYLMDVKTYIKWPLGKSSSKADEKKLFWKRLRKSLKHICWDGIQVI